MGLLFFRLDAVVGRGWTGRGGMFLAPAGNPSSLRFGHPDVATEHTDLSPTNSIPLPVVRGRVRVARWGIHRGPSAWEECARRRGRNTQVRYRRQLAGDKDWVAGIVVAQFRKSGCLPAGSARKGLPQLRERGAAIPSCSDIRVPELCEGGCPCRSEGSV